MKLTEYPSDVDSAGRKVLRFTADEWQSLEKQLSLARHWAADEVYKALKDIRLSTAGSVRRKRGWDNALKIIEKLEGPQ